MLYVYRCTFPYPTSPQHRAATHWKHGQCKLFPSVPWCVVEVQPCPLQTDNVVVRNQATGGLQGKPGNRK